MQSLNHTLFSTSKTAVCLCRQESCLQLEGEGISFAFFARRIYNFHIFLWGGGSRFLQRK